MRNKVIIAATTLLLSSCGTYTKYSTPDVAVDNLAGDKIELPDSSAVALPSWEATFTDAKLQVLINKALESNTNLAIARLSMDQAETMAKTSKLAFAPSFMLSPEGMTSSILTGSLKGTNAANSYSLPITTSWEIDVFGKLRNSKEQAKSALMQSSEYLQMVRTQLISNVATNYYTLLMLDEQLSVTKESAATLLETVEVMKSLKEAGMGSDAAVRQASANYQGVLISVDELETHISLYENIMSLLLNETPHSIERSEIKSVKFAEDLNSSISLAALSNRPDVRYSEMKLSQSFYGVNYARSSMYPSIKLSGSMGWTNNVGSIINPGQMLASAIGSLTQPLFMAGVNRANLSIAKSKYEQHVISFGDALQLAGKEVNDALISRESALKKQDLRFVQIKDLYGAVDATQELMNSGQASYLEVLVAQNSLLMSRINLAADWYEYAKGEVNLYKALGGGSER